VEKFGNFAFLSITKLFIAGVIPGLVMASSLLVMNHLISKKSGYRGLSENWSGSEVGAALKRGVWSVLAPVIILGGIYAGIFTPTESAIVAIFYTLCIG
jgi:C4-dicarboxylate transporter DctM subunit